MPFSHVGYPEKAGYHLSGRLIFFPLSCSCCAQFEHLWWLKEYWGLGFESSRSQGHGASWPYPPFFLSQVRYLVMLMSLAISQTRARRGERPGDEHIIMSDHSEAIDCTLCFFLSALPSIHFFSFSSSLSCFSKPCPSHAFICIH